MKIVFATYIDHQKEIGYPLGFQLKEIPSLRVFCSTGEEQAYLQEAYPKIQPTIIDHSIGSPEDIATAQNKCLDYLFVEGWDFVVWVQADIYLTEEAKRLVREVCIERNLHAAVTLKTRHLRLFYIAGTTYFGVNIVGRLCAGRFLQDGSHTSGAVSIGSDDCTIDIGYLSVQQCKNHLKRHAKTWNSTNNNYEWSDQDFVRDMLKPELGNGLNGLIPEGSVYWDLVVRMGMEEDYKYLKTLL